MNPADIPVEFLSTPVRQWQLNLTTIFLVVMLLGRAFKAIRQGGGLRGIWRGLLYGENVPTHVAEICKPDETQK